MFRVLHMYKPLFFFLFFSSMAWLACSRKSVPVISERAREVKPVTPAPVNIKPDTASGRVLFMNRCGRCHDLPVPARYTAARWEGILSFMIPRARLSEEQGLHVSAYLKAKAMN